MRDVVITLLILGLVPYILKRPYIGLLAWVWVSLMNPHRFAYGFAHNAPFAQVIAIATLLSMAFHSRTLYRMPVNGATLAQLGFILWIGVSPLFSIGGGDEFSGWFRVFKIQLMVVITYFLVSSREEIHKLIAVLTFSIAFFGIKGGLFTIGTGGNYRVWGPEGSYIEENNALALATIMTVPLLRYLQMYTKSKWGRQAYSLGMLLAIASALGSHSRGALLALAAMGTFFWMRSRNKVVIGILVAAAIPLIFAVMPEHWTSRMGTIKTYDQDDSAMGRINAWWQGWNIAVARFPIGGGFDIYTKELFARFAPVADDVHAAHSIYFQVLGQHGFGGLFFFLAFFGIAFLATIEIARTCRNRPELAWAADLAAMSQVCLISYAVGGAFLSLSYYDYPWYVAAMLVVLRETVKKTAGESKAAPAAVSGSNLPKGTGATP